MNFFFLKLMRPSDEGNYTSVASEIHADHSLAIRLYLVIRVSRLALKIEHFAFDWITNCRWPIRIFSIVSAVFLLEAVRWQNSWIFYDIQKPWAISPFWFLSPKKMRSNQSNRDSHTTVKIQGRLPLHWKDTCHHTTTAKLLSSVSFSVLCDFGEIFTINGFACCHCRSVIRLPTSVLFCFPSLNRSRIDRRRAIDLVEALTKFTTIGKSVLLKYEWQSVLSYAVVMAAAIPL